MMRLICSKPGHLVLVLLSVSAVAACGGQPIEDTVFQPAPVPAPLPSPGPVELRLSDSQSGAAVGHLGSGFVFEASVVSAQDKSTDGSSGYSFDTGFNRAVESARQ